MQSMTSGKKKKSAPAKQVTAARQATKLSASLLSRHEIVALSGFTYPWIWQMMQRGQSHCWRQDDVVSERSRCVARRTAGATIERRC
jgi:hypothetical protein